MSDKILVAMSGGVDSSVAALLLKEAGHEIVGVSMQVWDYRQNGGCGSRATCCSPDDFTDARRVAGKIGVPYYVFDFEESFRKQVIDKFVNQYRSGFTPNPCVECNNKVKFRELRERAETIGFNRVATGHYARIEKQGDHCRLLRGLDKTKDQSYFLYGLKREELPKTEFPVGHLTKEEVRAHARRHGLPVSDKAESQDICFVSGSVAEFIEKQAGSAIKGHIVNRKGQVLGRHDGIHRFTVGQRRGLGIGGKDDPLYVLQLDAEHGQVIVGEKEELEVEEFSVSEVNWIVEPAFPLRCIVQLRHRHAGVPVEVVLGDQNSVVVRFIKDWAPVAPGQAAVFYDLSNSEVLGGGAVSGFSCLEAHTGS